MRFEVLMSVMHATDFSIVEQSNLEKINTVIINQCDAEKEELVKDKNSKMLFTSTRGLSVSRNLAIQYADADVCLLCDDDEVFEDGLYEKVTKAYEAHPDADVIIFKMTNYPTKLGDTARKLGKFELLRVSSWQISFRLSSVKGKIFFDTNLGAGTKNGAGEENKFLLDCKKQGLSIYYVPVAIASVAQNVSTWFSGYDKRFFFNRGKTTRYMLGLALSLFYAAHFLVFKHKLYKKDCSFWSALKYLVKGIFAKDIDARYE